MKIHDRLATDIPSHVPVDIVVVDCPYEPGGKVRAYRSLRDDPVAAMHSAKQIDDAHLAAARHWQRAYELVEIGGARAIDPTKEAVDGGRFPEPMRDSEQRTRATGDLARASRALGMEGDALVRDVLGESLTVKDAALKRGLTDERSRRYVGQRFREAMDTLAKVLGYSMR